MIMSNEPHIKYHKADLRVMREYCFSTSLSAQAWQYCDRRKSEVETRPIFWVCPALIWLFIMHSTIDITAHSRPLTS